MIKRVNAFEMLETLDIPGCLAQLDETSMLAKELSVQHCEFCGNGHEAREGVVGSAGRDI